MTGKEGGRSQNNFGKMKRDMIKKKQRAELQQFSGPLQIDVEDKITDIKKHQDTILEVGSNFDNEEHLVESKMAQGLAPKLQQNDTELYTDIHRIGLLIFRLDSEEFAIRITSVKEIIRVPEMINVPNAPNYIKGLCSIRGELLPVISCRKLFGMDENAGGENSRIIVTDIGGKKVGLLADKVTEVINIEEIDIQKTPSSLKSIDGEVINGILILDNGKRVAIILDSEKICKACNLEEFKKQQRIEAATYTKQDKHESESEQIVVFSMGSEEYAFSIHNVKEIVRVSDIIKSPNAPSYIEGVLTVRNQLLAVINLGKLLGMNYNKHNEHSRIVIMDNGCLQFGVVVEKLPQVIIVQKKLFKESSQFTQCSFVKGIFNLNEGNRKIMMLDSRKLLSLDETKSFSDLHLQKITEKKSYLSSTESNRYEHIIVFKIDKQEYAVDIEYVQEINRLNEITKLPGAPRFIMGMVNLRGSIIPIINLRKVFNDNVAFIDHSSKFLVVEFGDKKIGILVDSASEVLKCSNNDFEETSNAIDGSFSYIGKIAKLNGGKRIVLILNLKAVLSFI